MRAIIIKLALFCFASSFSQTIYTESQSNEVFSQISANGLVYMIAGEVFIIENTTLSDNEVKEKDLYLFDGQILTVEKAIKIKIYNVLGQTLIEVKSNNANTSKLSLGIYFVTAFYEGHVSSFKILKHK